MIAVLKGVLYVGGVALASLLLFGRWQDRQVASATRRCACQCEILADFPDDYTRRDLALAMLPGETARYAWGGGMVVCLRPSEVEPALRFSAIRNAHDRRVEATR